jgi:hypothetical protein
MKDLNISSAKFSQIVGISENTPSAVWKKKNEIPNIVSIVLELLNRLPESDRVLFIHEKLKESQEKQRV